MTESEWLESSDPEDMRVALAIAKVTSKRRFRLVGCACCRRWWQMMGDVRSQQAVAGAELYADECLPVAELSRLTANAEKAWETAHNDFYKKSITATAIAGAASYISASHCDINTLSNTMGCAAEAALENEATELAAQAALLRDIFGNPFRPISINPAWLNPTVTSLAHAAYDERIMPSGELDPARLAVLSDALEEAGCDNADILNHLRGSGVHLRGCWAVDLLLGKE